MCRLTATSCRAITRSGTASLVTVPPAGMVWGFIEESSSIRIGRKRSFLDSQTDGRCSNRERSRGVGVVDANAHRVACNRHRRDNATVRIPVAQMTVDAIAILVT